VKTEGQAEIIVSRRVLAVKYDTASRLGGVGAAVGRRQVAGFIGACPDAVLPKVRMEKDRLCIAEIECRK
jgi:hypothetical protein